jgi:hypothetical protein
VAQVKLYDRKNALVAADMLNDRVLPWFEEQDGPLLRILTDRGSEYVGNVEHHEYELYLAVKNIDHTRTKAKSPQAGWPLSGRSICESFHRTMLEEFSRVTFRKKLYGSLEELQRHADAWIDFYNTQRPHIGRFCYGKTPMQTFIESRRFAQERRSEQLHQPVESALAA